MLLLLFGFFPVVQTAVAALVLADRDQVFGVALASLAPPALVVPMFLRRLKGDVSLGVAMVVAATLICPFVLVPMLRLLGFGDIYFDPATTSEYLALLTIVPVLCGFLFSGLFPRAKKSLLAHGAWLNSILLGTLMFILVGSALNHAPLRMWAHGGLIPLTAILVWMDFGVYFTVRWLWDETAALILSSRNFAIPASLLLFFEPRAALAPAIGLAVHAVFFQWLMVKKSLRVEAGPT
jgi:predicted Na+-dependent transporter